jgi:membrane protein involved in colicin uptake
MSETAVEATEATAEDTDQTAAETDWKAEARKHEKAAKELRAQLRDVTPKLSRLASLEAAQQTDAERQQAALAEAQQRADKAERDALRASVALRKGLPANLAARLQGDDEASLEADADELLTLVQKDTTARAPRPDSSQGSSARGSSTTSPRDQFAAIMQQQTGR